jgi:hypothetical protein
MRVMAANLRHGATVSTAHQCILHRFLETSNMRVLLVLLATASVAASGGDEARPWHWSPYVAAGYGTPIGMTIEGGINLGTFVFVGATIRRYGTWFDGANPTIGVHGGVRYPLEWHVVPYLLVGVGGEFRILGAGDEYYEAALGTSIPIQSWLYIRPEIGAFLASNVVSQSGWWGSEGVERSNTWRFSARVMVSVELGPLF